MDMTQDFGNNSNIIEALDEVKNHLLYRFFKNRDVQLGNNSEAVNIQKLEYIIECIAVADLSEIDILKLIGNIVDVLMYLRSNSKESRPYSLMVGFHNGIMDWLVTDGRYLNHMIVASEKAKSPPTRLAVTMPDGTVIKHQNASDTFVEVIDKLGRREVKKLDLEVNGKDLMSTFKDDQQRHKLGGYYINVGISTERKKKVLEDIASRLDVELEVEIIPK